MGVVSGDRKNVRHTLLELGLPVVNVDNNEAELPVESAGSHPNASHPSSVLVCPALSSERALVGLPSTATEAQNLQGGLY